jgi:hypothetical protein
MVVALSSVPGGRRRRRETGDADLMATKCSAIAKSGSRCTTPVVAGSVFCWMHAPERAEGRREAARKGGKARANAERARKQIPDAMSADELSGWLSLLFKNVMAGRIEPKIGTAAASIARVLHEVRHTTEIEQRLAELESRAGVVDTRWRA